MAETLRPEVVRPEVWLIDTVEEKLLEGAHKNIPSVEDFPLKVRLNPRWIGYFERLRHETIPTHDAGAVLIREVPGETGRILKTNADCTEVLIQEELQKGSAEHIIISRDSVIPPEVFLGDLHQHLHEAPLDSTDVTAMLLPQRQLLTGVLTPGKYYLALRSKETPVLAMREVTKYLLEMGKRYGQKPIRHRERGVLGVLMLPEMLKELNIPLYEGKRNQPDLHLAW